MRSRALLVLVSVLAGCADGGGPQGEADAPAPAAVGGVWYHHADGSNASAGGFEGEAPQFRLTTFPGVWGWEPSIGAGPDGAFYMAASHNVSLTGGPGEDHAVLVLRGAEGGASWTRHDPAMAGLRPADSVSSDPFLHVDAATGRVFAYKVHGCGTLAWSDDAAATWTVNPLACGNPFEDRPILGSGPTSLPTSDPAFPRALYLCSNQVAVSTCKRSLDGGLTFQQGALPFADASEPTCSAAAGNMQTTLAVSEGTGATYLARTACGLIQVARSDDGLATWTVSSFPHGRPPVCTHRGTPVTVDAAGNVYVAWLDEGCLPRLAVSSDAGASWSEPMRMARPGLHRASHLAVVAGAAGKVALSFMGSEHGGDAHAWSLHVAVVLDALAPRPVIASVDAGGRPLVAGNQAGWAGSGQGLHGVGDFLGMALSPDGRLAAAAVDVCQGPCGASADDAPLGRAAVAVQVAGTALR